MGNREKYELTDGMFYFRDRFIIRNDKEKEYKYEVFTKFEGGKPKNFLYAAKNLKQVTLIMQIFNEECDRPILDYMGLDVPPSILEE